LIFLHPGERKAKRLSAAISESRNRGEKLGVARLDLNSRIAEKIEEAELDPDQAALLDKLLGKDYEVITADERLDKIAADFVEHRTTRWESGKIMVVCIDKITCARMYQRIIPRWKAKAAQVRAAGEAKRADAVAIADEAARAMLLEEAAKLKAQADWLDETIIEIIISEAQNEVADFKKWGFDIIPHRALIKQGFETPDGKRVDVEEAFSLPHSKGECSRRDSRGSISRPRDLSTGMGWPVGPYEARKRAVRLARASLIVFVPTGIMRIPAVGRAALFKVTDPSRRERPLADRWKRDNAEGLPGHERRVGLLVSRVTLAQVIQIKR
jgi:hypothetical protein